MNHQQLQHDLVNRFGITPEEAKQQIRQAEARAAVKRQVAAASRGAVVDAAKAGEADFEQPQVWRHEVHRRLAAIEVMSDGVECLRSLQQHIKAVIEAEEQLIQKKQAKVRDKQCDWWDLRDSGWAMGGRERFATYVGDILRNLDEGGLGGRVMDRMGFKRSIPLPDIPEPVIDPAPRDADELVAALINGAKRVKAAQDPSVLEATLASIQIQAGDSDAGDFELVVLHRGMPAPKKMPYQWLQDLSGKSGKSKLQRVSRKARLTIAQVRDFATNKSRQDQLLAQAQKNVGQGRYLISVKLVALGKKNLTIANWDPWNKKWVTPDRISMASDPFQREAFEVAKAGIPYGYFL